MCKVKQRIFFVPTEIFFSRFKSSKIHFGGRYLLLLLKFLFISDAVPRQRPQSPTFLTSVFLFGSSHDSLSSGLYWCNQQSSGRAGSGRKQLHCPSSWNLDTLPPDASVCQQFRSSSELVSRESY